MQNSNSAPSGSWPVIGVAVAGQVLAKSTSVADGDGVELERSSGEVESEQAAIKTTAAVRTMRPARAPGAAGTRADGGMEKSFGTVSDKRECEADVELRLLYGKAYSEWQVASFMVR